MVSDEVSGLMGLAMQGGVIPVVFSAVFVSWVFSLAYAPGKLDLTMMLGLLVSSMCGLVLLEFAHDAYLVTLAVGAAFLPPLITLWAAVQVQPPPRRTPLQRPSIEKPAYQADQIFTGSVSFDFDHQRIDRRRYRG